MGVIIELMMMIVMINNDVKQAHFSFRLKISLKIRP